MNNELGVIYSRDGKLSKNAAKEAVNKIFRRNVVDNSRGKRNDGA